MMEELIYYILFILGTTLIGFVVYKFLSSQSKTPQHWYKLGDQYYFGKGKKIDYLQAKKCYGNALALGFHADSAYSLGYLYHKSQGVKIDIGKAKKWYTQAANKGHFEATKQLILLNNPEKNTLQEWKQLAEMYYKGENLPQDFIRAMICYKEALEYGSDTFVEYSIGWLYHYGEGVAQNIELAEDWYQKAAQKEFKSTVNKINSK